MNSHRVLAFQFMYCKSSRDFVGIERSIDLPFMPYNGLKLYISTDGSDATVGDLSWDFGANIWRCTLDELGANSLAELVEMAKPFLRDGWELVEHRGCSEVENLVRNVRKCLEPSGAGDGVTA